MLFKEPSPFAPGEILLQWTCSKLFYFLPPEVWGRLPGILWALLTIKLSYDLAQIERFSRKPLRFLPVLVGTSVLFMNLAVEMRPYASLFFGGAVFFTLVFEPRILLTNRKNYSLVWFSLLFGHVYGVCFVTLGCLIRKRLLGFVIGSCFVAWILSHYQTSYSHTSLALTISTAFILLRNHIREIAAALTNNYSFSIILAPLGVLGFFFLVFGKSPSLPRKKIFSHTLFLFVLYFSTTVLLPIIATAKAQYFFVPRQIVGGTFGFLVLVSFGVDFLFTKLHGKKSKTAHFGDLLFKMLLFTPLLCAYAFKIDRTFPNQPHHRFKEIAQLVKDNNKILLTDSCNEGPMVYYLSVAHKNQSINLQNSSATSRKQFDKFGLRIVEHCWYKKCLWVVHEQTYCSASGEQISSDQRFKNLILHEKFDWVVYGTKTLSVPYNSVRTW
ncbi:MAG: hypothetical protein AB7F43_08710 [Bacteriovoracia bacterium]